PEGRAMRHSRGLRSAAGGPGRAVRARMTRNPRDRLSVLAGDPRAAGLRRSLDLYYGDAARDAAMDALYARFAGRGELAFDIGSHVGDRIGAFRRIGARVVAVEPQPDCAHVLQTLYGDDPDVTLVEAACGRA